MFHMKHFNIFIVPSLEWNDDLDVTFDVSRETSCVSRVFSSINCANIGISNFYVLLIGVCLIILVSLFHVKHDTYS